MIDKKFYEHFRKNNTLTIKKILLKHLLDKNQFFDMAFVIACTYGNLEIVKFLLNDIRFSSDRFKTSSVYFDRCILDGLISASTNGHITIVKLLLSEDNIDLVFNENALIKKVAGSKHLEILKLILEDKRFKTFFNRCGIEPLVWASSNGYDAVVKLLLTDDEVQPYSIVQALDSACSHKHINTVKIILKSTKEINFQQSHSIWLSSYDIANILLKDGRIIVNKVSMLTAKSNAEYYGNKKLLRLLSKYSS